METETPPPWYERRTWKGFKSLIDVFPWVIIAVGGIIGIYYYNKEVNTQQTVNVADISRKLDALERRFDDYEKEDKVRFARFEETTLTIKLYEAYHKTDVEKLENLQRSIDMLATRP